MSIGPTTSTRGGRSCTGRRPKKELTKEMYFGISRCVVVDILPPFDRTSFLHAKKTSESGGDFVMKHASVTQRRNRSNSVPMESRRPFDGCSFVHAICDHKMPRATCTSLSDSTRGSSCQWARTKSVCLCLTMILILSDVSDQRLYKTLETSVVSSAVSAVELSSPYQILVRSLISSTVAAGRTV